MENNFKIREKRKKSNIIDFLEVENLVNEKLEEKTEYYEEDHASDLNIDYLPYDEFTFNNIIEQQIYYDDNYTKKDLHYIADYYSISKRKKTKSEIIQDIVLFEEDPSNTSLINRRKLLWYYLNEIKNDRYLKKFIIFK